MTSVTKLSDVVDLVIGVDTHVATHSAAIVDARTGGVIAEITVSADHEGYLELLDFAQQHEAHGALRAWALEGTGSHGRGLAHYLHAMNEVVVEVERPDRPRRAGGAKSDPLDAIRAARDALARARVGTPRGAGEDQGVARTRQALSVRLAARRSAVQAAGDARRQLFSAIVTAPEPLRARLRGLRAGALLDRILTLDPRTAWASADVEIAGTVACLRALARRIRGLDAEATAHEHHIKTLISSWRPDLLAQFGVGPVTAATVLCAWSHPGRVHSEAAFAKLAGTSPIEATSGAIATRHRLNRHGDRRLNAALHTIVLVRQR
ncbi:transposase, partial [Nocardioides marmoraquaticus]